jgi:hypothetical protein
MHAERARAVEHVAAFLIPEGNKASQLYRTPVSGETLGTHTHSERNWTVWQRAKLKISLLSEVCAAIAAGH